MRVCVCVCVLSVAYRILTVGCVTRQEGYWRATLFGEHIERQRAEGKAFNENAKTEATVTLQESLMRLFAVCNLQHTVLNGCGSSLS